MRIASDIDIGISPLEVTFSVVEMALSIVRWLWYFGDGTQSTEPNPIHTYNTPGVYSVTCTVWDEFGNQYTLTKENYIYVYDYTIGPEGLLTGLTDFCFKHAVQPLQGRGITPIGGTWVWPPLIAGTAKGIGNNHESVSLVINSETMEFIQIGIPELWTDRAGTYEESEIACEAMFPEIVSRNGPHENVRHVETHVAMRSWDERTYRGREGYTADGFRNAHSLSIEGYEEGEQIIPTTRLRQVQRRGDYALLKELEARRIQMKLKYTTSAFRTTRVEVHTQELDHRTPPQLNDVVEKQWQREFFSPDIWMFLSKSPVGTNRADGEEWTGTGTPITGPDQRLCGFNSTGITGTVAYTISDFTISGWLIGDGVLFSGQVQSGGTVVVEINGDTLRFDDGTNVVEFPLEASISWRHIAVVLESNTISLYEGGRLRVSQPIISGSYGGTVTVGNGTFFDIRRNSRAISGDALLYYYESVLDDGGGFLP